MNAKEKKLLRKQRKREMRFARKWVTLSILICACLSALIAAVITFGPSYLNSEIDFAIEKGNHEYALRVSEIFGEDKVQHTLNRIDYVKAMDTLKSGEYDKARSMFKALGNFENAQDMAKEAVYMKASGMYDREEYENAAAAFQEISGYKDAAVMKSWADYKLAERAEETGDFSDALKRFEALGEFEDAYDRRVSIAVSITGLQDPKAALDQASGLSEEEMEKLGKLSDARETLKNGWLDVGFKHTVARTSDGRALAVGSNAYGQLDVSEWSDIVYIAAGAYHTVGLRSDGTVVAVGRNDYKQTEVSSWENVTQIAVGAFDTYALTKNGEILHTGFNKDESYKSVQGITGIAAGSYVFAGLHANGSMLATHEVCAVSDQSGLTMMDVSTGYGVAIKRDGSVYATFGTLEWENVIQISAGGSGVMGIDADGNVLAHWFRKTDKYDFAGLRAVCVSAGGGHYAVLLEDGTVSVYGENESHQADTKAWKLF